LISIFVKSIQTAKRTSLKRTAERAKSEAPEHS
jgi:hypothetical protein